MNDAGAILDLAGVGRTFRSAADVDIPVLRDVDLRVETGEFVVLSGPSGSGKTTLLHLAALLDRPTAGRIRFCGRDVTRLPQDELATIRAAAVGTVYQQFHLLPHRSARDNVLFRFRYLDHDRAAAERAADAALERLGLTPVAHQPARLLSGGEMQRVAIARAMALPPRLLLADEPTGNLDAAAAQKVMDAFTRLHEEGHTLLLATHNAALRRRGSRQVALDAGRIREAAA